MRLGVLVLFVACASPHAVPFDGGLGGGGDALPDAPPDALPDAAGTGSGSSTGCADQDQDGICDAVDDCPTVADPAQVDPDGDGIGWMCDSSEHLQLTVDPNVQMFTIPRLVDDTFGLRADCIGTCVKQAVVIDPHGEVLARGDSGLARDAWLIGSGVNGPCITPDHQLWWSRYADLTTGVLDPVSGVYHPVTDQLLASCLEIDGAAALLGLSATPTASPFSLPPATTLAVVNGPGLATVATSTVGFGNEFTSTLVVTAAPAEIAIPQRTQTGPASLLQLRPGDLAASAVMIDGTPAADLTALNILDSTSTDHATAGPSIPYCAQRGGDSYYVAMAAGATVSLPLPFPCPSGQESPPRAPETHYVLGQPMPGMQSSTLVAIRDGVSFTVFDHEPVSYPTLTYDGVELQTVTLTGTSTLPEVWAVTSTNTSVLLAANLLAPRVSVYRDTIHVAGVDATTHALVVIRYREATGIEQFQLEATSADMLIPTVITTAEGAAIVGGSSQAFVIGAHASAGIPLGLAADQLAGSARGDTTVVLAKTLATGSEPAIYAYDERTGAPRATALTPETAAMKLYPLDPPTGAATDWFAYGEFCRLGRIAYSGTDPAFSGVPCYYDVEHIRMVGRTRTGTPIVLNPISGSDRIFALEPAGPVEVARFILSAEILVDGSRPDRPIVGWIGDDSLSIVGCLATHPDWCWKLDYPSWQPLPAHAGTGANEDSFGVVSYVQGAGKLSLQIVRTVDHGNRVQPLIDP